MRIIRAEHMGMCFGVRDAITLANQAAETEPVTVLGQLVHNPQVLKRMRRKGVRFVEQPEDADTGRALITAHGASEQFRQRARVAGLELTDTTCPLVASAHRALHGLVAEGCHPVVIGRRDHVEVRGLTEDLAAYDVVQSLADIDALIPRARFGVCAQTTQPIARVRKMVSHLRARFPAAEVRFVDTVCQPTKQRQTAAESVARRADVMVVIGGANSNNTAELSETCRQFCERVYQVERAEDLRTEWFESAEIVGLTAGTSTPDDVLDSVERRIENMAEDLHSAPKMERGEHAMNPTEEGMLARFSARMRDLAGRLTAPTEKEMAGVDWEGWRRRFARNRLNRVEPDWDVPKWIRPDRIRKLVRSLEQFELGDGGGPASLIAFNAVRFRERDESVRAVVDAWFEEEKEHARLLGCAVDRFGGRHIREHWSFSAFCMVRRWLGVRSELQVLLLTEMVSHAYYRILRRHVDDQPVRDMCALIMRDEAGHIAFHLDRLAAADCSVTGLRRTLWEVQFRLLGYLAATVLWINHGPCLFPIGAETGEYYRAVGRELARFCGRLRQRGEATAGGWSAALEREVR